MWHSRFFWAVVFIALSVALEIAVIPYSRRIPYANWSSGYSYLLRHWEFALPVTVLWILLSLLTWARSPQLRAVVVNEYRLIRRHGGLEIECPLKVVPVDRIPELGSSGQLRLIERRKAKA